MKKIKKIITLMIILTCFALTSIPVMAGGIEKLGDPGMNGYNYVTKTKVLDKKISFTHIASNKTSAPDSVTYSVSREKSSSGSLSGAVEFDAVVYKTKVQAEIGYGQKTTVSTSCTWSIPSNSSVMCRYGSALVNTRGTMEKWFNGRLSSSRTVDSKYTYASYSDKVPY